ncbi:MAG TPA: hypothetical protein VL614_21020 [Acetobacteraceae bacterium]|nr:hypothetical protein [Acetobacteraceae bacterium]
MTRPSDIPISTPILAFSLRQAVLCGLLALALDVAIGADHVRAVAGGELINPDSYMRFVRLRDILATRSAIDVVARDSSGAGTVLHWSHLLDSLLVLLATPLTIFMGQTEAIRWAGISLGPLAAGALGAAVAWATAPLTDPVFRWSAAVAVMLSVPVVGYAVPGVVHHHVLAALTTVMCAGWAGRVGIQGQPAGIGLGVWAAFGLWLTPEVMPISLLAFGAVGFGWLLKPSEPSWGTGLVAATTSLAVVTTLALAADPPAANPFDAEIDRLSIAWLAFAALAAGAGLGLCLLDRLHVPAPWRASAGLTLVMLAAVTWLASFPAILGGPEGVMNGINPNAFAGISEMQPIRSFQDAALTLSIGVFGMVVAAALAVSRRSCLFAYTAAAIVALLALALLHRRFGTYQACAGAAAVPVAVTMISRRLADRPPVWAALARLSLLLFLYTGPIAAYLLVGAATPAHETANGCEVAHAASLLRPYAGQVVLADVNITPELLYWTAVRTVGSLYHRGSPGYLRLRAAWRSMDTQQVPPAVLATGASLVLFCRGTRRTLLLGDLPPDTLWDQLARNKPPPWLSEVASATNGGFTLYRVTSP